MLTIRNNDVYHQLKFFESNVNRRISVLPKMTVRKKYGTSEEPPSGFAPLSHSAARHKMAVKPRRTHGAPRRKKTSQISLSSALPTTPEVNEDGRHEVRHSSAEVVTVTESNISEKVTTVRTTSKHTHYERTEQVLNEDTYESMPTEIRLKSSSLPPGLALSQMMGQSPIKLSLSEQKDSPQSSIKRSRSSAQNKNIRNLEEDQKQSISEKNLSEWGEPNNKHMANLLRNMDIKFGNDINNKFEEDDELMDIKKIEKKESKKEESFFSRLLLRKSGKKTKKDSCDGEAQSDLKKSGAQQYKQLKSELNSTNMPTIDQYVRHQKMTCSDVSSHKSIGQKVFSNQVHKRIDKKGGYVNDSLMQESTFAKGSIITDYGINDLKHFSEIEKVSSEIPTHSSSENIRFGPVPYQRMRQRIEPIDIDKPVIPPKDTKLIFPALPHKHIINSTSKENLIPLNNVPIPITNPDKSISCSVSPPRSVWPQNYDAKHKSNSQNSLTAAPVTFNLKYDVKPKITGLSSYQQKITQMETELENDADFSSFTDLAEYRNPVSKSQSFRFMSEAVSMNSHQENQMPSLPTMFGYSDSSMESWETNYKRQLREESEKLVENRRKSVSNVLTEKNSEPHRASLYSKNIMIGSNISQIEANIDSIIGTAKPLIAASLKSNSLDSVKNTEKLKERKALSSESILNNTSQPMLLSSVMFVTKEPSQPNFTIVNQKSREDIHFEIADKNNEKIYENVTDFNVTKPRYVAKTPTKNDGSIPEFMKIQLNKVDAKPMTNVVLSTSQNIITTNDDTQTPRSVKKYRDSLADIKSATIDRSFTHDKYDEYKPHRKFSAEDVEIIEKSNNQKLTKSTEHLAFENNKNSNLPPLSPNSYKPFYKKRQNSAEIIDSNRRNSSGMGIYENMTFEQSDSSQELNGNDAVVFRKKSNSANQGKTKKDDEPELMKVFARRSLKLKDSEADAIAQEILETDDIAVINKNSKSDFNAMIKSRDSDKENESNSPRDNRKTMLDLENKNRNEVQSPKSAIPRSHAFSGYQRSVSVSSVSAALTPKKDTGSYKKEVSDSTPEKRLRNRTFPDSTNEAARDDIKVINANTSSLPKRTWNQSKIEETPKKIPFRNLSFVTVEKKEAKPPNSPVHVKDSPVLENNTNDNEIAEGATDGSPQFKGILHMRAEWERRAKQAMTK